MVHARAVGVNGAGDQFLTGAALASDQHREPLACNTADRLVYLAHGRATADDATLSVRFHLGFIHCGRLAHTLSNVQRLADDPLQHGQIERLEQAVIGALLDHLDGHVCPAFPGDEDDRNACVDAADLLIDFQAALAGQAQVEDNDIRGAVADVLEPNPASADDLHAVRGCGECPAQLLRHQGRIIADEKQVGSDAVVGPVVADLKNSQLRNRVRFQGHGRAGEC